MVPHYFPSYQYGPSLLPKLSIHLKINLPFPVVFLKGTQLPLMSSWLLLKWHVQFPLVSHRQMDHRRREKFKKKYRQ